MNDPKVLAAKDEAEPIGPELPVEVIRHARKDRVLASFVENVWTEVGRCAACHSPDRNQKQVKEHGEQVSWIKLRDPAGTLNYMLEAGLIDTDEPEKSLLLAKPTIQVEHGGGQKMVVGDRTYKQFRRFIDDYAAVSLTWGRPGAVRAIPTPPAASGRLGVSRCDTSGRAPPAAFGRPEALRPEPFGEFPQVIADVVEVQDEVHVLGQPGQGLSEAVPEPGSAVGSNRPPT